MTCSIRACERPTAARGWCKIHYYRWHRNGNPTVLARIEPWALPPEKPLEPLTVREHSAAHKRMEVQG